MAPKRQGGANRKSKQPQQTLRSELAHMRWMVLAASLGLMLFAVVLRIQPSLLSKDTALASEIFGKVGIVFMCMWLAWPAIEMLWRAPSGMALFIAIVFAAGLFVYNRRTLYVTGPFLIVAAALAILLGWIRNQKRS